MRRRVRVCGALSTLALAIGVVVAPGGAAELSGAYRPQARNAPDNSAVSREMTLMRWASDTWESFVAMVDPATGLPADNIDADLDPASRSRYTSPTNIGGYLWSTVVARDLGLIGRHEAYTRMKQALTTMSQVERNGPSGMFYNWYDEHTGEVVTTWPEDGHTVIPFLSSVDNGWFAASLRVVRAAEPRLKQLAGSLYRSMRFAAFYNPEARPDQNVGLMRGGFTEVDPGGCSVLDNYLDEGPDVYYTCNHYDIVVTEPRLATYLGIANGEIPRKAYFGTHRTFPPICDFGFEQKPNGPTRRYLGIDVFEGAYTYRGMRIVPSWGGDMFEVLMPDLFVPEAKWGKRSWGVNHPLSVKAQIEHGLDEAGYGYWGFSPASDPFGTYRVWGVEELGMDPFGYPSDAEGTNVDKGFEGCREAENPNPTFGDGVVTPHAAFLALPYAPRAAVENLLGIEHDLGAYGAGGFYDAVAVRSGTAAERYLSLDQAMVLGPIGNFLGRDLIKRYFVDDRFEKRLRPLMAMEVFSARDRDD
jgi:hypothetical protein